MNVDFARWTHALLLGRSIARRWPCAIAALAGVVLLLACNAAKPELASPPSGSETGKPRVAPPAAKVVPLEDAPSELTAEQRAKVVARYAGKALTLGDVERELNSLSPHVRLRYNSLERLQEFVEELVRFELLAEEATRRGYGEHPEVVRLMKMEMVKRLLEEEPGKLLGASDVSDEDIRAYYDAHIADYALPARKRATVVAMTDLAMAQQVHATLSTVFEQEPARLRAAFVETVRQLSVDAPTKRKQGDAGLFTREGALEGGESAPIPRAVVDAVWNMAPKQELTGIITVEGTHWIALLTDEREAFDRPLDDVKNQIRNKLFRERRTQARESFIAEVRKAAAVEIDNAGLDAIPAPTFRGPDLHEHPDDAHPDHADHEHPHGGHAP